MIILGVDPGTIVTGFAIIKNEKNVVSLLESGIVKLPAANNLQQKLEIIYKELSMLIKKYKPNEFAIETAFYGKNVQSAMKIGYARGVSILAAAHYKIPSNEYSPREIKKSIVGTGAASKEQVSYMVKTLLNIKNTEMKFDESDACAVALCHAFRLKTPSSKKNSWKNFIDAYPERVIS